MTFTKRFNDFVQSEKSGGLLLIGCTLLSLSLANSALGDSYQDLWKTDLGGHSILHWVNDGLMAIFFLLVGLELEREVYIGELSKIKDSLLPVCAALGGMLVPAGIYLAFNYGTPASSGAGIPMATDIAFALGILSLLGNKVPTALKVFLTALAVIDDLGAIIIIALFYTKNLLVENLFIALFVFGFLLMLNRLKVKNLIPYLIGGALMWYFMGLSGIHATITGVLLAFAIPFGDGSKKSSSYKLQHFLHRPVTFFILPVFALANTAIVINTGFSAIFTQPYSIGIGLGLVVGKPLGIVLFVFAAIAAGICRLPKGLDLKSILGAGFLGGIGFTMSIFITMLAFDDTNLINNAKLVILLSSLIAAILGYVFLNVVLKIRDAK